MKNTVSMIALAALFAASAAMPATAQQHYNGTGGTRGFVNKTGFVKSRTNEDNHMGKNAAAEQEKTDEAAEAEDAEEDKAAAEEEKAEKEGKDE